MSEKMRFTVVSAAAFVFALSVAEAGVVYTNEAEALWFAAGVTNLSTVGGAANTSFVDGDRWTAPVEGSAVATNKTIQFEAEVAYPLIYTAQQNSGAIAIVNVSLFIDPNVATPSTNDLGNAQAAISVVTNTANGNLDWVGLAKVNEELTWVTLDGDHPTANAKYDVQIALDNRDGQKKIRYAVRNAESESTPYSVLTYGGNDGWLSNPKSMSSVSAVAFAGAGTIGEFGGVSLLDDGAEIASIDNLNNGYDFTNGTVTAVVTLPAENASDSPRTATLRIVDFATGNTKTYDAVNVTSGATISWNLDELVPGGSYSYSVTVKSGGSEREVKSGTFTAGNWFDDGSWFKLAVENGQAVTNNGVLAGAEFSSTKWNVSSDAAFTVTNISNGSNAVAHVDTAYAFSSFTDFESLESLDDDALGGIVAVSDNDGDRWCAYTGAGETGWESLVGGIVPKTNTEYVVRAEFDFFSTTKRVRYMVATNGAGLEFVPLARANGSEWINLVNNRGSLSSVGMSGSGYVASIKGNVSDGAVATAGGNRYSSLWEAIASGNVPVTLLTNATLAPTGAPGKRQFSVNKDRFNVVIDLSNLSGKWILDDDSNGNYVLRKPGATYIFF